MIGGIAGVLASISGAMPETQSIGGLIAGGFFFPFAVVALKNWMAKR